MGLASLFADKVSNHIKISTVVDPMMIVSERKVSNHIKISTVVDILKSTDTVGFKPH